MRAVGRSAWLPLMAITTARTKQTTANIRTEKQADQR